MNEETQAVTAEFERQESRWAATSASEEKERLQTGQSMVAGAEGRPKDGEGLGSVSGTGSAGGRSGLRTEREEGRVAGGGGFLEGEEEGAEPKTRPWPWNLEEKGLLTFFMRPFILSFISSIVGDH